MTTDDRKREMIEKAAKALTELTDAEWEIATAEGVEHLKGYFEAAERVWAVFESGQKPTNSNERRWAHCSPALLRSSLDCAPAPRKACACEPANGGHDHLIRKPQHAEHVTVEWAYSGNCLEGECEHVDEDGEPEDLSACPTVPPFEVCVDCMDAATVGRDSGNWDDAPLVAWPCALRAAAEARGADC